MGLTPVRPVVPSNCHGGWELSASVFDGTRGRMAMNPKLNVSPWKDAMADGYLLYGMQQGNGAARVYSPETYHATYYKEGFCFGCSVWWLKLMTLGENFNYKDHWVTGLPNVTIEIQRAMSLAIAGGTEVEAAELRTAKTFSLPLRALNVTTKDISHRMFTQLANHNMAGAIIAFNGKGGHAMASIKDRKHLHFFDPNFGHLQFPNAGAMLKFLNQVGYLTTIYGAQQIGDFDLLVR